VQEQGLILFHFFDLILKKCFDMDALIEVSSSEFNEELFKKIKSLIKSVGIGEITIKVNNPESTLLRKETPEEYWSRIDKSVKDIDEGKGIVFTIEELQEYVHKIAAG